MGTIDIKQWLVLGEKEERFLIEDTTKKMGFISEHEDSYLELVSADWRPMVNVSFDKRTNDREDEEFNMEDFISIKSFKAHGNRLTKFKVKSIDLGESLHYEEPIPEISEEDDTESENQPTLF